MMVSVGPFPRISTLALMSRSAEDASAALLALVIVSWIGLPSVACAKLMIQAGFGGAHVAVAFSLMTASRRLQSVDAAVTQLVPVGPGEGSSLRFTVKVTAPAIAGGSAAQRAAAARNASTEIVDGRSADA